MISMGMFYCAKHKRFWIFDVLCPICYPKKKK